MVQRKQIPGLSDILATAFFSGSASITGTTAETELYSFTLPPDLLTNLGQHLEILQIWSVTGNTNAKTLRLRLGSITGILLQAFSITVAAQTLALPNRRLTYTGMTNFQSVNPGVAVADSAGIAGTVVDGSLNWAASNTIVATAQLTNAADTVSLRQINVRLFR